MFEIVSETDTNFGEGRRPFLLRRLLYRESWHLTVDACMARRRSTRLIAASLFARAAANVLIDDAKIGQIECRMSLIR